MSSTRAFQELTMFMEHIIRKNFKSFSFFALCGAERNKFMVDAYFEGAFINLTIAEQIELYQKTIANAIAIQQSGHESQIEINLDEESEAVGEGK